MEVILEWVLISGHFTLCLCLCLFVCLFVFLFFVFFCFFFLFFFSFFGNGMSFFEFGLNGSLQMVVF